MGEQSLAIVTFSSYLAEIDIADELCVGALSA
jgi:hypothetical protein